MRITAFRRITRRWSRRCWGRCSSTTARSKKFPSFCAPRIFTIRCRGGFVAFHQSLTKAIQQAELAYQREGQVTGVATGFIDLDKKLGGLQKSDLVILAGRPAMGKTALATNMAFSAAKSYLESQGK